MPLRKDDPAKPLQKSSRSGVQSVDIALGILQVLMHAETPLSLKEFSYRCRMSPSKLHRYLHSFAEAGLITHTHRAGEYALGKLALELGLAAIQRIDLLNNAADMLHLLAIETGAPASLSVWSAHGPTIIRWQRGSEPINTAFSVGSVLPLLISATGNVFLAYLPERTTAPVISREASSIPPAELTRTIDDIKQVVRREGHAISRGAFIPGLTGLAAPILNGDHEALAAVTILTQSGEGSAKERSLVNSLLTFAASCSVANL